MINSIHHVNVLLYEVVRDLTEMLLDTKEIKTKQELQKLAEETERLREKAIRFELEQDFLKRANLN